MQEAVNSLIEDSILQASEGNREAIKNLLLGLLKGPIYVPNREQTLKLTHQPVYPAELTSILGVQDNERVIVPVFSRSDFIKDWFEKELFYKCYSGTSLFNILPDDWWLCINPGQEVEKDISPWEITKLKEGENSLPEILAEITSETDVINTIEYKNIAEGEYLELINQLKGLAAKEHIIDKMHILIEVTQTTEGKNLEKLVIGVECDTLENNVIEKTKEEVKKVCDYNLIGSIDCKVLCAASGNNILLGIFKDSTPFYKSV